MKTAESPFLLPSLCCYCCQSGICDWRNDELAWLALHMALRLRSRDIDRHRAHLRQLGWGFTDSLV
jgi:hypothetical protein